MEGSHRQIRSKLDCGQPAKCMVKRGAVVLSVVLFLLRVRRRKKRLDLIVARLSES